jgi:hypothetical protein
LHAAALAQVYNFLEAALKDPSPWSDADRARILQLLQNVAPLASESQKEQLLEAMVQRFGPELKTCPIADLNSLQTVFLAFGAKTDQIVVLCSQWLNASDQWRSLSYENATALIGFLRGNATAPTPEVKQVVEYTLSKFLNSPQWRLETARSTWNQTAPRFVPSLTTEQRDQLRKAVVEQFFADQKLCASLPSNDCVSLATFCTNLGATSEQASALYLTWEKAGDNWRKETPEALLGMVPAVPVDGGARAGIVSQVAADLSDDSFLKQARGQGRIFALASSASAYLSEQQKAGLLSYFANEMAADINELPFIQFASVRDAYSSLGAKPSQVARVAYDWMQRQEQWKKCQPEQLIVLIKMLALDPELKA